MAVKHLIRQISQTGWSGQNTQTSTAYTSGTQATYTIQTSLSSNTTYYWRAYATDPGGSLLWSSAPSPFAFTTTTAPSAPTTPYAEGATNPTGIIDNTPEFSAIHNDANADPAVFYEIEVNTNNTFTSTVMWDSGQVAMTSTANGVRSPDISLYWHHTFMGIHILLAHPFYRQSWIHWCVECHSAIRHKCHSQNS